MAQDGVTGLDAGHLLDLVGDVLTNATEAGTTVLFGTLVCHDVVEAFGDEAFSNDNQGRTAAVVYFLDPFSDLFHRDLNLGD